MDLSRGWLPITLVGSLIVVTVSGAVWLNSKFLQVDFRLERIEQKVADPWNIDKMRAWRDLLEKGNPQVWVPPVRKD